MDRFDFCRALARDAGKLAHAAFGTSGDDDEGRARRRHRDGPRGRALHPRRDRASAIRSDAIIGEEEGGADRRRALWIIDPIDGTANYARGLPHYCVSIGYLERGVPTLGAIYDPSHDWLYAAARGEGAWRDGERLAGQPVRRHERGDRRMRLVDAPPGATTSRWSGAC